MKKLESPTGGYVPPRVETLEVHVESGFALTTPGNVNDFITGDAW